MSRRNGLAARRGLLIGIGLALAIAILIGVSIERSYQPPGLPPEALERIAAKNREAATGAAATMRAESAATTNAIENINDAAERNAGAANGL